MSSCCRAVDADAMRDVDTRPAKPRRRGKRLMLAGLAAVCGLGLVAGAALLVYWARMPRADETVHIVLPGHESRPITIECFYPESKVPDQPLPAVIIFHGVEGSHHPIGRPLHLAGARRIADSGCAVYFVHYFDACDYDNLVFFDDAGELDVAAIDKFRRTDQPLWVAAAGAAMRDIVNRPETDDERVVVIGYSLGCFVGIEATQQAVNDAEYPAPAAFVGGFGGAWKTARFSADFPATRFFHGEDDRVVTLEHVRSTVGRMRQAGVADVELVSYPNQPHVISGDARQDMRKRLEAFLARELSRNTTR